MNHILKNGIISTNVYKFILSFSFIFFIGYSLTAGDFKPREEVMDIVQTELTEISSNTPVLSAVNEASQARQAHKRYLKSFYLLLENEESKSVEELFQQNHETLILSVQGHDFMIQTYSRIKDELELKIRE